MGDWFDDESFWEGLYPFLFRSEVFDAAEEEVDRIVDLTGFSGTAVLDLACGPGRHTVSFAQRGYQVTGVDLSEFLLEQARLRADHAGVEVEWSRADIRRFHRERSFDLALILYTSLGFFADSSDDLRVLENVHRSLRPGGALVVDLLGKEILARIYQATTSHRLDDGSLLVEEHEVVDGWHRIRNRWTLVRDNGVSTYEFEHTVYSGQELRDKLRRAGFSEVTLYGDLGGSDYGPEADRLVAVARR